MTKIKDLRQQKTRVDLLDRDLILLAVLEERSEEPLDRSFLVSHGEEEISEQQLARFYQMLKRREMGEPLAYILGYRDFYGRRFMVSPDVLIPRPETEDLVELVKSTQPSVVVDVGTGSGCIAISLALDLEDAIVLGVDVSSAALEVAQKNAQDLGLVDRKLYFILADLLDFDFDKKTSLRNVAVVANLPYVDKNWKWNSPALKYEPSTALYADEGGLALIKRLIDEFIKKSEGLNWHLFLEADKTQHQPIIDYAKSVGLEMFAEAGLALGFRVKSDFKERFTKPEENNRDS